MQRFSRELLFFPEARLLLSLYVDDFTLAGPEPEHDKFWHDLAVVVGLDPPAPLGRVLRRQHNLKDPPYDADDNGAMRACTNVLGFDMTMYAEQCVKNYFDVPDSKPLKHASTPFVPEGSLAAEDEDVIGSYSRTPAASS